MDILLITTNAKIRKMSVRRQKIAIKNRPRTLFKDCWPASVGDIVNDQGAFAMDVTFSYPIPKQ